MEFTVHNVAHMCGSNVASLGPLIEQVREGSAYRRAVIPGRGNKRREIIVPNLLYSLVLKQLGYKLARGISYSAPSHVHGFVRGRSAYTNAACHLDKNCVLRIDLESFFPSISSVEVGDSLAKFGFDRDAVEMIVGLTTINSSLAIGLNTSPLLSNLVFTKTDAQLVEYADTRNMTFTRYVDDLVFSGDVIENRHRDEIYDLLEANNWSVNRSKTAFMRRGKAQYVTGLYVGCSDRPRIPRHIKRALRAADYLIERFGYVEYMTEFGGRYSRWGSARKLVGWARYISSVEPEFGKPLLARFDRLIGHPEVEEFDRRADYEDYLCSTLD
ncbi:reverse transcriptase family protein [Rhodococcus sp. DT1]|uniref:reverse transcriptase family protein n=1 Tax=Rhodococcus sp. DT1 TaxID=3416544 RepID=UPI003CF2B77F